MTASWSVTRRQGSAHDLHADDGIDGRGRAVWVLEIDRPAIVLGSTQRDTALDDRAVQRLALDVVVRRSGGGAVLLVPGKHVWIDVFLPRDDPLWDDDVSKSALWLGEAWSAAFESLGLASASVHRGPMQRANLGRLVCFAGVAAGEVLLADAKLVGISQRRTRAGARFQCIVLREWDIEPMLAALASVIDDDDAASLRAVEVATLDRSGAEIESAFLNQLA